MTEEQHVHTHDFDRLFRQEGPGVWRTMYAYTGGRAVVAEEATAEAFARAIAHSLTIRDPLAWIYRTAFRVAKEELRRERREPPRSAEVVDAPEVSDLLAALRQLSASQRAAIVLRYDADLPIEDIARRMGSRRPRVRVHLYRGRRRLAQLLGVEETDD